MFLNGKKGHFLHLERPTEYVGAVKEEFAKACGEALRAYGNYEVKVTPGVPWEQILIRKPPALPVKGDVIA